jgi:Leucine-rich repeat (LRR) protein
VPDNAEEEQGYADDDFEEYDDEKRFVTPTDEETEAMLSLRLWESSDWFGNLPSYKQSTVTDRVNAALAEDSARLDLSQTELDDDALSMLPWRWLDELDALVVWGNDIKVIPAELVNCLVSITRLQFDANRRLRDIQALGEGVRTLETLTFFDCPIADTGIVHIMHGCPNLRTLNMGRCGITALPEDFGEHLTSLESLQLHQNKLSELPLSITKLKRCRQLEIQGNPLQKPPRAVASKGMACITRYFDAMTAEGGGYHQHCATMVLVGNGEAGKTSLLKTTMKKKATLMELDARTIAVDINLWHPEDDDGTMASSMQLEVRCWDMAGQPGYHGCV